MAESSTKLSWDIMEIPDGVEKKEGTEKGTQSAENLSEKRDGLEGGVKPDYAILMRKLKGLSKVLAKFKYEKARPVGLKPFAAKDGMAEGWTLTVAFPKTMENESFMSDVNLKVEVAEAIKELTGAAFIGEGKEGG